MTFSPRNQTSFVVGKKKNSIFLSFYFFPFLFTFLISPTSHRLLFPTPFYSVTLLSKSNNSLKTQPYVPRPKAMVSNLGSLTIINAKISIFIQTHINHSLVPNSAKYNHYFFYPHNILLFTSPPPILF